MKKKLIIFTTLLFLILVSNSYSQFYKVYGYATRAEDEAEISLWTSYISQSDHYHSFFDKKVKREGLWAHSVELEYGVTDRFTVAIYIDFENPSGESLKHIRTNAVFFRYRIAEKGSFLFDPAIYLEYYIPRKDYRDYEEFEARLILERDMGDFRLILNPIFEKKTSGSLVSQGFEFNYAAGFYYRKFHSVQPGIEFHGKMGEMSENIPLEEQRHFLFSTLDFKFGPGFHWHIGTGIGLTDKSDKLTIKSILSFKF
ncbi:MAG: hypothetical protein ACETWK_14175 [Candidatus Aminicenantaceae bacterium]